MKRTITLVAVLCLLQTLAFGQKKYEMVIEKTDGTETVINVEDIVRTYFRERTDESGDSCESGVSYTGCLDVNHPHMIDLGLASGTKWACCNVGANALEEYGDYFAWGETKPKDYYNWSTYIHCDGTKETCHDLGLGNIADAATANWGLPWKMPTRGQLDELFRLTSEWTQENGIYGRKFTGSNGATIFLPAAGLRWSSELDDAGSNGYYWSSTLNVRYRDGAWFLGFSSRSAYTNDCYLFIGQPVRPVR